MAKQKKDQAAQLPEADVYVASDSGVCEIDGEPLVYVKNVTRVRAGHALLDAVPHSFTPIDEAIHYDVEDQKATTEKRGE